ncbi:MAG: hypothetical protein KGQ59_02805, partial [Bdellovibrionales bacterium]|nr:hypothetical protein [Bdellovibrionales bacterium]
TSILEPSVSLWMNSAERKSLETKLHQVARQKLLTLPPGSDQQRRWWSVALRTCSEREDAEWISKLLTGKSKIPGLAMEQDRRWEALEAWARVPNRDFEKFLLALKQEESADQTDSGKKSALAISAAMASSESKLAAFERAVSEQVSFSELRALAGSFGRYGSETLYPWLNDRFFAAFPKVLEKKTNEEAATFVSGFFPLSCQEQGSSQLKTLLDQGKGIPASVFRRLQAIQEEQERCIRLRKLQNNGAVVGT